MHAGPEREADSGPSLAARSLTVLCGILTVACCAVIGVALATQLRGTGNGPSTLAPAFYPWWTWVLMIAGLVAGGAIAASAVSERHELGPASAVVAAIATGQLAGTGIVAVKHAKPATGMGGLPTSALADVQRMSLVIAVAAAIAVLANVALLMRRRAISISAPNRVLLTAGLLGVLVVLGVPLAIALVSLEMRDVTSLGAVGLIYAGPWAVSIAVSGWLREGPAVAALVTVGASACLALVGPQLGDMGIGRGAPAFSAALLAAALAFAARRTAGAGEPSSGRQHA